MAHYDCSHCGHAGGIAYGYCDNCTPKNVFQLRQELTTVVRNAEAEFEKRIKDIKNKYIDDCVVDIRKEYETAYEEGKKKQP